MLAIDIPIGLMECGARGCDTEARRLLGPRRGTSVFPAPIRPVLSARTLLEASTLRFAAEKKRMSAQAYGILNRVREVDMQMTNEHQKWIREVHPEISFLTWSGGRRLPSKRKRDGLTERFDLIESVWPGERDRLASELKDYRGWSTDDLHDAFAALWTARRISSATAVSMPAGAVTADRRNLRMEIVC